MRDRFRLPTNENVRKALAHFHPVTNWFRADPAEQAAGGVIPGEKKVIQEVAQVRRYEIKSRMCCW